MFATILAGLEAILADPTVDAEIIAAAKTVYAFLSGPSAEQVKANMEAAGRTSDDQVRAFVAGSAADLAENQQKLADVLAHPDLPPALVPVVVSVQKWMAGK